MSFIDVGHIAMGITTIIPIYDFIYLPQEDDVEEPSVPKGAPISSPEQQVMGFYMTGGQPGMMQMPMMQMPPTVMMSPPMQPQMMAPGMMMMPTKV